MRRVPIAGVFALGLVVWPAVPSFSQAADDLAAQIEAVTNGPDYRQARWGILVVDAPSGKTVYEQNADKRYTPASTTKLFTCAGALIALGPDFKFETPVYSRGPVKDGKLQGDLILVAKGDLTLGGRTLPDGRMAFKDDDHTYANTPIGKAGLTDTDPLAGLKSLARQIKEAGIRHVQGDVLIDDRLFARSAGTGSGPGLLTPIVVNDNAVDVIVKPAKTVGELAEVAIRPDTRFVQMDARVETVAADQRARIDLDEAGPNRFVVRGQIPVKSRPLVRIYAVDDPAGFARALFIETLGREGVVVDASPLKAPQKELPAKDAYAQLPRVAAYTSPPFSELMKVTLKVSHNLYASTLPILVAVHDGKRTLASGLHLQRKHLAGLGLDVDMVSFAGGAGGAIADSVSPRATVNLLLAMSKRPDFSVYRDALPVLGVDGTLATVIAKDSPARGQARAKTGTLFATDVLNERMLLRSKALAGYLTTAKGRPLAFAMFVNDVPLPRGVLPTREGKVLGRLCEIIHRHGP